MRRATPINFPLRAGRVGATVLLLCAGATAVAQEFSGVALQALAQSWVTQAMGQQPAPDGAALRLEATVGALDARVKLAPCAATEAYVPAGARLWGRSRVAVRCTDGQARWNVTLPVTVKAMGEAWVLRQPVPAGSPIGDADVVRAWVDWAEEPQPVLAQRSAWLGQNATRALPAGQTLRQGMVRPAQVFQAGAFVKVVAQGPGFSVSSEATALSAGVVGQAARVRMDNGRIASGTVLDGRTVQIDL